MSLVAIRTALPKEEKGRLTMKAQRMTALMSAMVLILGLAATSAQAVTKETSKLDELVQLLQQDGQGSESFGGTLRQSQAAVNLSNGYIRFVVSDWPVSEAAAAGSESTQIKGTLVCNASTGAQATLVDTPSVPLSENGQASFNGQVALPGACIAAPDDLAFFVRTAMVTAE